MALLQSSDAGRHARVTALVLLVLLVIRLGLILLSDLELYADEAQYWRWSRTVELGYYSKPPMIAWVIGAATAIFGNAEWAIRLPAPLLHTVAAFALFGLGRAMFDARVGMFAAIGYALMPGVIVSASVISTDGVLLPFWCTALFLLWRLREGEAGWASALLLGVCIGAGFLSKYAMIYFFVGLGLTTVFDAPTRRALTSVKGIAALLTALAVMAPHLIWNAANDFATVGHTVDNANLGGDLVNPENLGKFLEDQMGVFGPISFLALLGGVFAFVIRPGEAGRDRRDLWLLAFIVPVIIIIAGQSVLSRAHANWAATAYPAASILVAAWLLRARPHASLWIAIAVITGVAFLFAPDVTLLTRVATGGVFAGAILGVGLWAKWRPSGLLWTSISLHGLIAGLLVAIVAAPPTFSTALGADQGMRRLKGWDQAATEIAARARAENATAILVDEREVWHGLDYYMRDEDAPPLIAWRRNPGPKSFSESRPLSDEIDDRVLVASFRPQFRPRLRADFNTFEVIGEIATPLGFRANGCPLERRFVLYIGSDYTPLERTQAWEDRFEGLQERPSPPCPAP